jgi:hypothetical protein
MEVVMAMVTMPIQWSLAQPEGYVANSDDCDDLDSNAHLDCSPTVVETVCGSQPYTGIGPNSSAPELHILSA